MLWHRLSLLHASDSYSYGRHSDRHILAGLDADQDLPRVRKALGTGGGPQLLVDRPHALRVAEKLSDTSGSGTGEAREHQDASARRRPSHPDQAIVFQYIVGERAR